MHWKRLRFDLVVVGAFYWLAAVPVDAQAPVFEALYAVENGDINGDGSRDMSDGVGVLQYLYLSGAAPVSATCEFEAPAVDNGDTNGDGDIDMSDGVALLSWLFTGGRDPEPFCPEAESLNLPEAGHGGPPSLRIISPRARFEGRTYGEWSQFWWRWFMKLPVTGHPVLDPAACDKGQGGPVWFIAGPFGDPSTRECTVPQGKAILLPVLNVECSNVEPPPFFGGNEAELRACAKAFMDTGTGLRAVVNGRDVRHLDRFRLQSSVFGLNYPAENFLGVPGPGSTLSVSDGVWLLIAPPEVGEYEIHFEGSFPGAPVNLTLRLNVVPPDIDPRVVSVDRRVGGKTYGDWGAEWWKFVYAQPFSQSPPSVTGPECFPDQTGPVHFLFGTYGGAVTRSCTIRADKHLFFPLLNSFNDHPCPDPAFNPAAGQSLEDFLGAFLDPIFSNPLITLEATLDGDPLENLQSFRAFSHLETFTADISNLALDTCVTGEPQVGVADGYWVMLKPLSVGDHLLHFRGTMNFFGFPFETDVTYNLNIVRGHHH